MSKEEYHYVFKQIGDNIRKAREAKRLSQEELLFLLILQETILVV